MNVGAIIEGHEGETGSELIRIKNEWVITTIFLLQDSSRSFGSNFYNKQLGLIILINFNVYDKIWNYQLYPVGVLFFYFSLKK